jgi:hypothetical protein
LAEAGSVRVALFEEQTFDSRQIASFKSAVQTRLPTRSALVQTLAPKTKNRLTFIFAKPAKFSCARNYIERREATVIQATLAPQILAELLKNPDEMGKALTDEATTSDP